MVVSVRLDERLRSRGMAVTLPELVAILADHWAPAQPGSESCCPGCGHEYTPEAPECPTAAVVRPLVAQRRWEGKPGTVPWKQSELRRPAGGPSRAGSRSEPSGSDSPLFELAPVVRGATLTAVAVLLAVALSACSVTWDSPSGGPQRGVTCEMTES